MLLVMESLRFQLAQDRMRASRRRRCDAIGVFTVQARCSAALTKSIAFLIYSIQLKRHLCHREVHLNDLVPTQTVYYTFTVSGNIFDV